MQNQSTSARTAVKTTFKSSLLFRQAPILAILMLAAVFLSSCAKVSPHMQDCITSSPYGFLGGLWHGIIILFSWIGSLFSDSIAIYAYNNNGGWYDFGFILGIGCLTGGSSKAVSK